MNEIQFSRRFLHAAVGLLGLAAWTQAQTLTHTFNGAAAYDRFGAAVAGGGDVTGNGRPDLVVGATQDVNIFSPGNGFVRVYTSTSATPVFTWQGTSPYDAFGAAVAILGDVSQPADGRADVLIGAPNAGVGQTGQVQVRSGLNGAVLHQINGDFSGDLFGFSVAAAGDVNGDGVPDFIVGAPLYSQVVANGGRVKVFSGANGSLIHTFDGTVSNGRSGWSVAGGDLNGDGRSEIIVGSLFNGVRVYNGVTGALMHNWIGGTNDIFGKSVAYVPILGPSGIPGVVVGATQESIFSPGTGYVRAFRGDNGSVLWTSFGLNIGDRFGFSVANARTWDGDTVHDVIVGVVPMSQGLFSSYSILSGTTGATLGGATAATADSAFGSTIAGLGDWNVNGSVDVAVGVPQGAPSGVGSGQALVYESGAQGCGSVTTYCTAAPNSTGLAAVLSTSVGSTSVAANNFSLSCSQMPLAQFALAFYSTAEANSPFGNGTLCVSPQYRVNPPQPTLGTGTIVAPVDLANPPEPAAQITAGSTWNFQVWYRDSAMGVGSNLSNPIKVTFCP